MPQRGSRLSFGPGAHSRYRRGAMSARPIDPARLDAALARALDAAEAGPQWGPNPRVGCAIIDADGTLSAVGHHRGAGTAHAEVDALAQLCGRDATGATAVVTLEPCSHTGRTGPCTDALASAGIARVIYAVADPNPVAAQGACALRAAGLEVATASEAGADPDLVARARRLTAQWRVAVSRGRPWVIAKSALSADGFVAAADGTSQWITSQSSRAHAHALRARVDAIVVGTGTALADDPSLTARAPDGRPLDHQPTRVVVGLRDLPAESTLARLGYVAHRTRDLARVCDDLYAADARRILLEGGPRLVTQAFAAGLVDEWHVYRAPVLLGEGTAAIGPIGVTTLSEARRLLPIETSALGPDQFTIYAVSKEAHDVYRTR